MRKETLRKKVENRFNILVEASPCTIRPDGTKVPRAEWFTVNGIKCTIIKWFNGMMSVMLNDELYKAFDCNIEDGVEPIFEFIYNNTCKED